MKRSVIKNIKLKNLAKRGNIITSVTLILLVSVLALFVSVDKSFAVVTNDKKYTREKLQDMIVSTALSYYYNTSYSDYGQRALDNSEVVTGQNYYTSSTVNWRDTTVSPEMVSRSNYYHVDCSDFAYLVYKNTIGYDAAEYIDQLTSTMFDQTRINEKTKATFKLKNISNDSTKLNYYRDLALRLGKMWNSSHLSNAAGEMLKNAKETETKTAEGVEYTKVTATNTELVYYYEGEIKNENGDFIDNTDTISNESKKVNSVWKNIMKETEKNSDNGLKPGDIILIRRNVKDSKTLKRKISGHVMVYVGNANGKFGEGNYLIHSGGDDYTTNTSAENNKLFKDSSIRYDKVSSGGTKDTDYITSRTSKYMLVVLRPINTVCESDNACGIGNTSNPNNIYLSDTEIKNSEARVELNNFGIEQYMAINKQYNINSEPNIDNNPGEDGYDTVNVTKSKFNSINIDDPITYKLYITKKNNNENNLKLTITAQVPEGTTYVSKSSTNENVAINKSKNVITWTVDADTDIGTGLTLSYIVRPTREGTLTNSGFKITTSSEKELQMAELNITVKPTQNSNDMNLLKAEVDKFETAVKNGKIVWVNSGKHSDNIKDLDSITETTSISSFGFVKMAYYNAFGLDLEFDENKNEIDTITYPKIADSLFTKLINYNKGDNVYGTSSPKNIYALRLAKNATELTGSKKKIYDMLVPGMYGGRYLRGNDDGNRIKFLRSFKFNSYHSDLEYGDIIIGLTSTAEYTDTGEKNAAEETKWLYQGTKITGKAWLYLGYDDNGPVLARFRCAQYNSDNECTDSQLLITTDQNLSTYYADTNKTADDKPSNQILNELFDYDLFAVLRPSRIGKTIKYDYNHKTEQSIYNHEKSIAYNTYQGLTTPKINDYSLTLDKGKGGNATYTVKSTFAGWYSDEALSNKVTNGDSLSSDSNKVYAKWIANLPLPSLTGYNFSGWYKDTSYTKEVLKKSNSTDKYIVDNTVDTLYAKWSPISYEVKFNANGGEGTIANEKFNYDESKSLSKNTYTKEGYKFTSWNTKKDGSGDKYTDTQEISNLATTDGKVITLYAQWSPITYTVKFNANGGEGSTADVTLAYGEANKYPVVFAKEGYKFISLNTKKDGSGKNYLLTESLINLSSTDKDVITLYAQYQANTYTIKFDSNGGKGSLADEEFTYGESKAISKNTYTKEGYKFTSWNTKKDGSGDKYTDTQEVSNLTTTDGKVIILYAQWSPITYTVKFNANGGEGSTADVTLAYGEANKYPVVFAKEGYKFISLNTKKDGSGKNYLLTESLINLSSTDKDVITLYAQYQANTYTIEFDSNSGEGTMMAQELIYDKESRLSINTFTKDNYIFIGWSNSTTGDVKYVDEANVKNLTVKDKETIKIYAVWREREADDLDVEIKISDSTIKKTVKKNEKLTYEIGLLDKYDIKDVSCSNDQKAKLDGNVFTINKVTKNTTCTVKVNIKEFTVKYEVDDNLKLIGLKEEKVKYGESPSGTQLEANKNFIVEWYADKDVTLKNNKVIKQGEIITEAKIKQIAVKEDLVLSAKSKKRSETVEVPDTGKAKSIIIGIMGLIATIGGGYTIYKVKKTN